MSTLLAEPHVFGMLGIKVARYSLQIFRHFYENLFTRPTLFYHFLVQLGQEFM